MSAKNLHDCSRPLRETRELSEEREDMLKEKGLSRTF